MEEKLSSGTFLIEKNIHSDLSEIEEILKDFNKKCDEISILLNNSSSISNITQIMMKFTNLQDLIKSINTHVSKIQNMMSSNVKNSENEMALIKEVIYNSQVANRKFNSVSSKFMSIVERTRSKYELEINSKNEEDLQVQKLQKNKFYKQKVKHEEIRNEELNKEFEIVIKITNQIHELSHSMLNELNMQGKKLSLIEENMIDSHYNLIRANKELDDLAESSGTKNRLFSWICLLLFVIFLIALFIFAFYYKKKQEDDSTNSPTNESHNSLNVTTLKLLNLRNNRNYSDNLSSNLPLDSFSFYSNETNQTFDLDEHTSTNTYENDIRNKAKLDSVHKIDPFSQNNNNNNTNYTICNNNDKIKITDDWEKDKFNRTVGNSIQEKLINKDYFPPEVPREIEYSPLFDGESNITKYNNKKNNESFKDNHSENVTNSIDYLPGDYKEIAGSVNFMTSVENTDTANFLLNESVKLKIVVDDNGILKSNDSNLNNTKNVEIVPIPLYHIVLKEKENSSKINLKN